MSQGEVCDCQALGDNVAKRLTWMEEMGMAAGASWCPGGTSHKASSMTSKRESPKHPVLKGQEEPTLHHRATSKEILSPPSGSRAQMVQPLHQRASEGRVRRDHPSSPPAETRRGSPKARAGPQRSLAQTSWRKQPPNAGPCGS